jgi:hypothetical protein
MSEAAYACCSPDDPLDDLPVTDWAWILQWGCRLTEP